MTLDELVQAAGLVGHVVVLDKLGREYIAWLRNGDATPILVSDTSCEGAIQKLGWRLDEWLQTAPHDRAQVARSLLNLPRPSGPDDQLLDWLSNSFDDDHG